MPSYLKSPDEVVDYPIDFTGRLLPGETIVTAGVHLLREGEKVRIAEVPKA